MDKKNIIPEQNQPILRPILGTRADLLAEQVEAKCCNAMGVFASRRYRQPHYVVRYRSTSAV